MLPDSVFCLLLFHIHVQSNTFRSSRTCCSVHACLTSLSNTHSILSCAIVCREITQLSHMPERHQLSSGIQSHTHTVRHANGFRVVSGRTSAEHPHVFDLAACTIAGVCHTSSTLASVKPRVSCATVFAEVTHTKLSHTRSDGIEHVFSHARSDSGDGQHQSRTCIIYLSVCVAGHS